MNYADETLKAKYARTAFAFLFEDRSVPKPLKITDDELAKKAYIKANNAKQNAKRKANNIKADNKQKANWTI